MTFFNGDLQKDIEKHRSADNVEITATEGNGCWYLDINDDGYFYLNPRERDFDYQFASTLFN